MTGGRALLRVALADFRERVRSRSFLLVLAVTAWLGYTAVPSASAGYSVMSFAGYRGVYNSAWVGAMVALYTSGFLSLPGFYLIRTAIEHDRTSGVGQILAASAVSRWSYLFGKAFSNFLVLGTAALVMALAAPGMQLIRGEDLTLNLWQLWGPFLLLAVPSLALIAGVALIFEVIPWLRGTLGNVLYFFAWAMLMSLPAVPVAGTGVVVGDAFGMWSTYDLLRPVMHQLRPGYLGGFTFLGDGRALPVFSWQGFTWTPALIGNRLSWLVAAALLVFAAGLLFRRDDLAGRKPPRPSRERERHRGWRGEAPPVEMPPTSTPPATGPGSAPQTAWAGLPQLDAKMKGSPLAALVWQEMRVAWRDINRWWLLIGAGLLVTSVLVPLPVALRQVLPFLWMVTLPLWSGMGTREVTYGADGLVFYADRLLSRQLPALWLAGFANALLVASGLLARLMLAGEWAHLGALVIGAAFIPSLALALGVWTGAARTFEIVYTVIWYLGLWEEVDSLNFIGSTEQALVVHVPWMFLTVAVVALAAAVAGRWRQVYPVRRV